MISHTYKNYLKKNHILKCKKNMTGKKMKNQMRIIKWKLKMKNWTRRNYYKN